MPHGAHDANARLHADMGWGAFTMENLAVGEFVCEYTGCVLRCAQHFRARLVLLAVPEPGDILTDREADSRCATPGRDAYLFNLTTPKQCARLGLEAPGGGEGDAQSRCLLIIMRCQHEFSIKRLLCHLLAGSTV